MRKKLRMAILRIEDTVVTSKDEVGDLGHTLNIMTANLRNMIGTVKTTSVQLTQNSLDTAASLNEMQMAIQQVAHNMSETAASISDGTINAEHASTILSSLANDLQDSKEKAELSVGNSQRTMKIAEEGQHSVNDISNDMEKIESPQMKQAVRFKI